MIRPGSLTAAMVIHALEMSNLIHACIGEGSHILVFAIGNCKGVKENH
jgi:hypothetical protein